MEEKQILKKGNQHFKVAVVATQGQRSSMEDTFVVQCKMEKHNAALFGIFDGHSGSEAAKFTAKRLPELLDALTEFTLQSVEEAVLQLDKEYLQTSDSESTGTTAIFSIVLPKDKPQSNSNNNSAGKPSYEILTFNIGDSRAVLGRGAKKTFELLSKDHRPGHIEESKRIMKARGYIEMDRVGGLIAISRAIGDRDFKVPVDFSPREQQVICLPDLKVAHVEDPTPQDFLLLYCDGLYEKLSNEQLVSFVQSQLEKDPSQDPANIAAGLVDYALKSPSSDNLTTILVLFQDGTSYQ